MGRVARLPRGDPVAREIVERGAKALAETVEVTAARTNLIAPEIVMGGILKSEVMLEPLRAHLLARLPEMRLVVAELSPAHGACLLARACFECDSWVSMYRTRS